ncbi:uncharacterized protein DS421_18g624220 [Arachis hypogaea]|nr:uncharacterized protein DS421_18g624220 [Arachis hypogaea]
MAATRDGGDEHDSMRSSSSSSRHWLTSLSLSSTLRQRWRGGSQPCRRRPLLLPFSFFFPSPPLFFPVLCVCVCVTVMAGLEGG